MLLQPGKLLLMGFAILSKIELASCAMYSKSESITKGKAWSVGIMIDGISDFLKTPLTQMLNKNYSGPSINNFRCLWPFFDPFPSSSDFFSAPLRMRSDLAEATLKVFTSSASVLTELLKNRGNCHVDNQTFDIEHFRDLCQQNINLMQGNLIFFVLFQIEYP